MLPFHVSLTLKLHENNVLKQLGWKKRNVSRMMAQQWSSGMNEMSECDCESFFIKAENDEEFSTLGKVQILRDRFFWDFFLFIEIKY